jgi:NAD(P)-dependent dehydrogenase (short-subunit alcohol dehydrogenase family)
VGEVEGKVVIVTGGSRGVGLGIARRFLEAGALVATCSRSDLPSAPAAEGIAGAEERSLHLRCNHRHWPEIDAFVEAVLKRFGRLDVLVNNAGGALPLKRSADVGELPARLSGIKTGEMDPGFVAPLFHRLVIENNLIGPLWFALRAYAEFRRQATGGSIINISSGASHPAGSPHLVSYGAAKAGLNHLTRSLAVEWAPEVRVNCVALGPFLTENMRRIVLPKDEAGQREYFASVPLGRAGRPEEVGDVCLFLCSKAAEFITGATIAHDGGIMPGPLLDRGAL